jgi:hypothetical protein
MAAERLEMATAQRFVSVNVLVTEIQKHLLDYRGRARCEATVEHDLLTLLAHFRAQRMGLKEFCARLRVLIGAAVLMATVQGLSGQAAGADSPSACRKDTERPAKRSSQEEVASAPAVAMGTGPLKKRRASYSGDSVGESSRCCWTPAEEARLRALPALESGKQQWTGGAGHAI